MRDLYSVLHVAPKASEAEIKSAFRSLAKTCHPDVRPGDREAEEAFQEAKRAYQYLSNPATRKAYDEFLAGQRAAGRARRRSAARTMSASFLLTAAAVVLAAIWLQPGSAVTAFEHAGAREMAREVAHAPAADRSLPAPSPAEEAEATIRQ